MRAMILAAGEGTRLRPLTTDLPKPMLEIGSRPALEYIVRWLRYYGIRDILINLHYRPDAVQRYFRDGSAFDAAIRYSVEDSILGTAGGAKRCEDFFDGPFIVAYGDVLTDFDLSALIAHHASCDSGVHLTLSLYHVPDPERCGVVCLDDRGRVTAFVEKPAPGQSRSDLASAGVLVVDREILSYVPEGRYYDYGHDLFPELIRRSVPMYGWPIPQDSYLIDFGTPENYVRSQREWPTPRARNVLDKRPA